MKHALENTTIEYDIVGDGHPIVILHAMGTDHRAMRSWMEDVFSQKPGWSRIYIDLPGHGGSQMSRYAKTSDEVLSIKLTKDVYCKYLYRSG